MNQGDERRNGAAAAHDGERQDQQEALAPESAQETQESQAVGAEGAAADEAVSTAASAEEKPRQMSSAEVSASSTTPLEQPAPETAPVNGQNGVAAPLAAGAAIGDYTILRLLRTDPHETVYLAEERGDVGAVGEPDGADSADAAPLPPRRVRIVERALGAFAAIAPVVRAALHHPRLLVPRELFEQEGRAYLVIESLLAPDGTEPVSVADGARLDAAQALAAGAGLADALSYLHRNGVAHLHVSPDVVIVLNGRAYLDGVETAERIADGVTDMAALFARDANFLARSLGILAGVAEEPHPQESPAEGLLRQIAALGASGSFAGPDEVAGICASGLQTSPSLSPVSRESQARLSFLYGSATTVGKVRTENQDACASIVFDVFDDVSSDMPLCLFLVADGMGGEARGEMASRIAARAVTAEIARQFAFPALIRPVDVATGEDSGIRAAGLGSQGMRRALQQAVEEANRRVRLLASYLGQTTGTTLTAIATQGGKAALAHLGDSRAYLLRGDTMATLTEDHSVLARLQAIDHPLLSDPDVFVPRNMLYRSLGQEDDPNPDMMDFTLADGDRILICSDGLWDELDDQTLAETLAAATDPHDCAARLVAMANDAGGNDNSTAVVVFVQEAADPDRTGSEAGGSAAQAGGATGEAVRSPAEAADEAGSAAPAKDEQPASES